MKHAAPATLPAYKERWPTRNAGWTETSRYYDVIAQSIPYTPGKHAKPFAAHHPARPVTYNKAGTTTPLNPPTHRLDTVA